MENKTEIKYYIVFPSKILSYPKNILLDSAFLKGTLIYNHLFGECQQYDNIFLNYDEKLCPYLISLIRSGKLYLPDNDNDRLEVCEFLDFVGINNKIWCAFSEIIKKGAIDLFGRVISKPGSLSTEDLFFISPFDEDEDEKNRRRMNLAKIVGIKYSIRTTQKISNYFEPIKYNRLLINVELNKEFENTDEYFNLVVKSFKESITKNYIELDKKLRSI